jgi:hypothetical protein
LSTESTISALISLAAGALQEQAAKLAELVSVFNITGQGGGKRMAVRTALAAPVF